MLGSNAFRMLSVIMSPGVLIILLPEFYDSLSKLFGEVKGSYVVNLFECGRIWLVDRVESEFGALNYRLNVASKI